MLDAGRDAREALASTMDVWPAMIDTALDDARHDHGRSRL
jgi:hypothetical protein